MITGSTGKGSKTSQEVADLLQAVRGTDFSVVGGFKTFTSITSMIDDIQHGQLNFNLAKKVLSLAGKDTSGKMSEVVTRLNTI